MDTLDESGVHHGLKIVSWHLERDVIDAQTVEFSMTSSGDRAQGYRVKRLSACGGCLGDYRR